MYFLLQQTEAKPQCSYVKYVAYVCELDRCSYHYINLQKIFMQNFDAIFSRVKVSCSGKKQVYLTQLIPCILTQ